jgi:hypothetical protein
MTRVISRSWIGKNVDESGPHLIEGTIPNPTGLCVLPETDL